MYHQNGASDVRNSIFWANSDAGGETSAAQIFVNVGTVTATYSDIQGGWPGADNINLDPLFMDADGADNITGTLDDNLRLAGTSPAIDAGDNFAIPDDAFDLDGDTIASEPTPEDIAGQLRFADAPLRPDSGNGLLPIVDMGAYEYQGTTLECALADANVCTCESYQTGICVYTTIEYGNVNCSVNQSPNLDDILCTLNGFASLANCPNSDIAPPCTGNNLINLEDILASLSAFGGLDPCGCNP